MVRHLLARGAQVTRAVEAAAHTGGRAETYAALLSAGLDPNGDFGHAGTPLTEAVVANDPAWVALLLGAGADPERGSFQGNMAALAAAIDAGAGVEVVRALLDGGADARASGLLTLAAKRGASKEVTELLLQRGARTRE